MLHQAWHSPTNTSGVRTMLMHTMAEWYRQAETDQARLSRILDVAQDLKVRGWLCGIGRDGTARELQTVRARGGSSGTVAADVLPALTGSWWNCEPFPLSGTYH